ncbi:MAG: AMP-binding protein [Deltaproteobacteria bacterium]|nr:AMP-binding protein [Deltaproteobacteria bacterium]MBW2049682.1 AMP-binding protein [Deltaproteobacteria bacterium]MBW2112065.1 AMP-binding protein [Deltaproteobacteria bacterium]MBW2354392.1 AMP-binding protein [Deltaproteobacteria bacterium]HDZ90157.1 long-chain fatty acid--CoA ligase [Deltaproteobacteria bacterium]
MLEDTLLGLIIKNADEMPDEVAIREKRYGVWSPMTWSQFRDNVQRFALGLRSLGFEPGDNLAIIGDNKPEWIIAEFGCMGAGGLPTGAYPDSMAEEMEYLISYSDARFLVVRDQEQVDKILAIWERIGNQVERVVVWDSRGMSHYYGEYTFLERFEKVLDMGAEKERDQKDYLLKLVERLDPTKPALMLTTSGTTAKPKLSLLSHENFIEASKSYGEVVEMRRGDELLSAAPLSWIGEQLYNVARFLMVGARYNFPEETETLRKDLLELQPYYFGGTPIVWEFIISTIQAAMDNADVVKRYFYNKAIGTALKCADAELAGQDPGKWNRFLHRTLNFFVLRPLKNKVGLGRVRMAVTGGGAISPEVFKYFKALGLDLRQVFGQSECSGIATTHKADDVRPETVGVPIPNVEIKLSKEGEILVRGKNTHLGYYKNEEATKAGFTEDGFLRTGDAGYFGEDGHLYVFDRAKDIMTLEDGTRFAPQDIETRLKFSAYIHEAMVCGGDRPYVSAIVSIDLENVGNWAKKRGISFTTFQDLSQRTEVYELIRNEIRKICERFPENIRIKRFAILLKELHPDDGELTRTRKIRRAFVNERYHDLIEDLYRAGNEHDLDIEIQYEDGRTSKFSGTIAIEEV